MKVLLLGNKAKRKKERPTVKETTITRKKEGYQKNRTT